MRPLQLKLAGLRSYRNEETVTFGDRSLVAIVGDTGAGKSSLLEAITFALYGESTWSGQPGELISDNVKTMRVELTFLAAGEKWQATRAMSKDNYPAPIHKLKNLATGEEINGKTAVRKRVEQLVGLDCSAFLKTVILPQGRFAELLTETKANRDRILKNLFRVDELEAARDQAKALQDRLTPRLDLLRLARGNYLADPAAAEADAIHRLDQARARTRELETVEEQLRSLDAVIVESSRRSRELGQLTDAVDVDSARQAADMLRNLAEAAAEYDARIGAAKQDIGRLDADAHNAQQALEEAEADGLGITELNAAKAALEAFDRTRLDLVQQITDLSTERTATEQQGETVDRLAAAAEQASVTATEKEEVAGGLEEDAQAAKEAVRLAQEALGCAQAEQRRLAEMQERVATLTGKLEEAEAKAADARARVDEAAERLAATQVEREAAERAAAAAHAAEGLHAGDDCPVCDRPLPEGFEPPRSPELDAARATHNNAVADADEAKAAKAAADASVVERQKALGDAEEDVAQQTVVRDFALSELAERLGYSREVLDPSALDANVLLASMTAAADERGTRAGTTKKEAADAEKEAALSQADHRGAVEKLTDMTGRLARLEEGTKRSLQRLASDLATIPETWRPSGVAAAFEADYATRMLLEGIDVSQAIEDVVHRTAELQRLQTAANAAAKRRNEAATGLEELSADRRRLVELPSQQAINVVHGYVSPVEQLATSLDAPDPSTPPASGVEPSEAARITELLVSEGESLLAAAQKAISELDASVMSAETQAKETLAAAKVTQRKQLVEARAAAMAEELTATTDMERAQREAPIVADLEDRTEQAKRFLGDVRLVREMLADSKFIGYLIGRRQQALLGVATTILDDITAGRFGFTADFMVLDKLSGQPRSPRTLSGGESFLASLALALGMVELAARAGGRLDALFLDEGFGALDASSLDAAIDALERRARTGQLVAVISHVRAVAERIPEILAVRGTPLGTRTKWMSDAERAEAVDEDVTESLSGLLA